MRRLVKTVAAHGLRAAGAPRVIGALNGRRRAPLVVCYHRVVEDLRAHPLSAPAMMVSARTLLEQLDWLGRRFRLVPLEEAVREAGGDGDGGAPRGGRPAAAVTFDDGYADVYEVALPLLRRKGVPAAVFVVTDLLGTRRLQVHDRLYALLALCRARFGTSDLVAVLRRVGTGERVCRRLEEGRGTLAEVTEHLLVSWPRSEVERLIAGLERLDEVEIPPETAEALRPMTWEMVGDLHREGVTIGSHTRSHRILPNETAADVRDELTGSKRALEERLGAGIDHLSYPAGQFSPGAVEAARAAGYRHAFTTCHHRAPEHPELTIPRRTFWEGSGAGWIASFSPAVAACQVAGVFDAWRACSTDHGLGSGAGTGLQGGRLHRAGPDEGAAS
ncbi:MAG: polysaccharide deacetylase family protein [Thermoanaerobaculia bacterium]